MSRAWSPPRARRERITTRLVKAPSASQEAGEPAHNWLVRGVDNQRRIYERRNGERKGSLDQTLTTDVNDVIRTRLSEPTKKQCDLGTRTCQAGRTVYYYFTYNIQSVSTRNSSHLSLGEPHFTWRLTSRILITEFQSPLKLHRLQPTATRFKCFCPILKKHNAGKSTINSTLQQSPVPPPQQYCHSRRLFCHRQVHHFSRRTGDAHPKKTDRRSGSNHASDKDQPRSDAQLNGTKFTAPQRNRAAHMITTEASA
jgi:hypothetical protein